MSAGAFWIDTREAAKLAQARERYRRKEQAGTATAADWRALVRRFGRTMGWERAALVRARVRRTRSARGRRR